MLHLHLVKLGHDHFNRVFHGADVDLRLGQLLEGRIEGGGFTRAGGTRYQHDAMVLRDHPVPLGDVRFVEAKCRKVLHQHVGIEDTHHQLLTKGGGHGGEAQLHFIAIGGLGLDTTILWAALFHHVHATQHLDAAGHHGHYRGRHFIDRLQGAIDTETDITIVTPRFHMDITGPLVKGILQ